MLNNTNKKKKRLHAIQIKTKDLVFNREEANKR